MPLLLSLFLATRGMKHYPTVLSIAGSDPSGGAGIQADIKTCTAMGCYAMAAITALTAQNTLGVRSILNASDFLNNQLLAALDDITPDAVKIGMLPDEQAVMTVASVIEKYALKNIVLDPVMTATSGLSAIRSITLSRPDLVLLDYEMPVCSGDQILEMIRSEKEFANIPIIFLTSRVDRESVKKVIQHKPQGYLSKSLSPELIKKEVDRFFNNDGNAGSDKKE